MTMLTIDEVQTAFHEFGHALHGMLTKCRYVDVSGTNVTRDFVETFSQFNENWAFQPEILAEYAHHYQTGEVIPDSLVAKINNSLKFNQGFMTRPTAYISSFARLIPKSFSRPCARGAYSLDATQEASRKTPKWQLLQMSIFALCKTVIPPNLRRGALQMRSLTREKCPSFWRPSSADSYKCSDIPMQERSSWQISLLSSVALNIRRSIRASSIYLDCWR